MSYTQDEIYGMTFDRLNSIYSDMEGINVLTDLVGDNLEIQNYVEYEIHEYSLVFIPKQDKKNRTTEEGDVYFGKLVAKLYRELNLRGMNNEANNVLEYLSFNNKRMTEAQYTRSLREPRIKKALELGMNKTNAKALSRVIEQLCFEVYS